MEPAVRCMSAGPSNDAHRAAWSLGSYRCTAHHHGIVCELQIDPLSRQQRLLLPASCFSSCFRCFRQNSSSARAGNVRDTMHHEVLRDRLTEPCYVQALRQSTKARASANADQAICDMCSMHRAQATSGDTTLHTCEYPEEILLPACREKAEGKRHSRQLGSIARLDAGRASEIHSTGQAAAPGANSSDQGQLGIHRCQVSVSRHKQNDPTGQASFNVAPRRPWGSTRMGRRPCSSASMDRRTFKSTLQILFCSSEKCL